MPWLSTTTPRRGFNLGYRRMAISWRFWSLNWSCLASIMKMYLYLYYRSMTSCGRREERLRIGAYEPYCKSRKTGLPCLPPRGWLGIPPRFLIPRTCDRDGHGDFCGPWRAGNRKDGREMAVMTLMSDKSQSTNAVPETSKTLG